MTSHAEAKASPDAERGIALSALKPRIPFVAHYQNEDIVLVREGGRVFAVGAKCSHYGGPLSQGRVSEHGIHCPWHHACFSLADGHATRAPGIEPIVSYRVEIQQQTVRVLGRQQPALGGAPGPHPASVTIVGGGGAGWAAVRRLRHQGYKKDIHVFCEDGQDPYDRTKLSKAYLAGKAGRNTLPLASETTRADAQTHMHLSRKVEKLDVKTRTLELADGTQHAFHALVLATGATPKMLPLTDTPTVPVHVLRSLDDADALVALAAPKARVVVVGAGFIGLEAAASFCQQGLSVDVLTPDPKPLDKLVGATLGHEIRRAHREAGVRFHLGAEFKNADATGVNLASGEHIDCDFVVAGIGVTPNDGLAREAGIDVADGILVDTLMRTSAPDIFAVGDVARVRAKHDASGVRIEHWAVALGHAQVAADNILGSSTTYSAPPFFWTEHFGIKVRYCGHAAQWDEAVDYGAMKEGRFATALREKGVTRAVVTVGCDEISLAAEACLEGADEPGLKEALKAV